MGFVHHAKTDNFEILLEILLLKNPFFSFLDTLEIKVHFHFATPPSLGQG